MSASEAKRQLEQVTGVSNVTSDLVAVLHNKLQAVAALEEYRSDAQDAGDTEAQTLFGNLQQREVNDIQELSALLQQRLGGGPGGSAPGHPGTDTGVGPAATVVRDPGERA